MCKVDFFVDDYRFGFNGQEKVDEISGVGNHNTALFWEYDTRLGRRWNVDPVVKPWRSPFDAFNNNPIIMIDPNGDDDFFDNKGNYLRSSGKGTVIRIEGVKGVKTITDINFKKIRSMQDLYYRISLSSKIFSYYGKQVGVDGSVGVEVNSNSRGHTSGDQVCMTVNANTGTFATNDYNSVKNILSHEKGHQNDFQSDVENNRPTAITFEDHVNVFIGQFNSSTFGSIGEAERVGDVAIAVGYALNSIANKVDGSDRRDNLTGNYSVLDNINKSISKYGISVELNDKNDVKKGYKLNNKEGVREIKYETKKDPN
jgi:Metallopeptidase toxin 2